VRFRSLLGVVAKDVSVSSLGVLHVDDGLVDVVHRDLLDPRVNVLLDHQVEHLLDDVGGSDEGSGERDVAHDEGSRVEARETTIGETEEDHGLTGLEEGEVTGDGHVRGVDSADDEVQRSDVFRKVSGRSIAGRDELGRALFSASAFLESECEMAVTLAPRALAKRRAK